MRNPLRSDSRSVSVQELRAKVRGAVGLCENERERLFRMLEFFFLHDRESVR